MYVLRSVDGLSLNQCNFHVGRDADNDIVIVDYTISKQHAKISYTKGRYTLEDNHSRNGSTLNGKPLVPSSIYTLKERDVFSFGRIVFILFRPMSLFINFRAHQAKGKQLVTDARILCQKADLAQLQDIAQKNNIPHQRKKRHTLTEDLIKQLGALSLLYMLGGN